MKILMIPSWYATEDKPMSGIFFKEQAAALGAAGCEVRVVYPDLRFRLGGLRRGMFDAPGEPPCLILRRRTLTPFIERGRWPQRTKMLRELYKEALARWGRPDIVQLQSCRMGIETLSLCREQGLPLVYTEHYSGVMRDCSGALAAEFTRTLLGCDRALAVSSCLRDKMMPLRPDASVVPNLIDTSRFVPAPPPGGEFTFAAMGNLVRVKRYDLLIRAFALARSGLDGARLVIAGEGPLRGELEALIRSLGAGGKITLAGAVGRADVPAFFARANCVVCSSELETFGMTLIEALACGRPVVSTDCGGPRDIVTPSCGILVRPGSAQALAAALRDMRGGYSRYDPQALSHSCGEKFGAARVAGRLADIYGETAENYRRRTSANG
jgi:glycosyltransferase involved in cell wall biosynthesis